MKDDVKEEVVKLEPVAVRYQVAAQLLDSSESTARKLVKEGKLRAIKVGDDDRVIVKSIRELTGEGA